MARQRHTQARLAFILASSRHVQDVVLECMVFHGLVDVVESLTQWSNSTYDHFPCLLQLAAYHGHVTMLEYLYASDYPSNYGCGSYASYSDMEV
ncbi:Aste57867_24232 [Aphanomyces stellatus]|uniref:Aste57867_24232 protein n=1 Tax=Aphanomyces stellatus TaxID=120398 RepID=A0A485LQZ3_9STRA|nr:hypothetical protein As57867_024157 [Aphanomyces stellatus]VFU00873.1 Aste57867_24232 [Aphanomyces stellatus]